MLGLFHTNGYIWRYSLFTGHTGYVGQRTARFRYTEKYLHTVAERPGYRQRPVYRWQIAHLWRRPAISRGFGHSQSKHTEMEEVLQFAAPSPAAAHIPPRR